MPNYELTKWIQNNLEFDQLILENYRRGEPHSGWVHISQRKMPGENRKDVLTYFNKAYNKGLII